MFVTTTVNKEVDAAKHECADGSACDGYTCFHGVFNMQFNMLESNTS